MTGLAKVVCFSLILYPLFAGTVQPASQSSPSPALISGHQPVNLSEDRLKLKALDEAKIGLWRVYFDLSQLVQSGSKVFHGLNTEQGELFYPSSNFSLDLPDRPDLVQLKIREIHHISEGVITYSGYMDSEQANVVNITIDKSSNHVFAKLHLGHQVYLIQSSEYPQKTLLHAIDKRRLSPFQCSSDLGNETIFGEQLFYSKHEGSFDQSGSGNGNIRALFYYTPEVGAAGPIDLLIDAIIAEMNATAYISGINPKNYISVAKKIQTNDSFNGTIPVYSDCSFYGCCSIFQVLSEMNNEVGEFAQISSEMDTHHADIAVVLLSTACNRLGGAILSTHDMDDPVPFAVITDQFALGDLTALHEIGHLLGSGHELTATDNPDPIAGAPANARGFVEPNPPLGGARWQTIMGGYQSPSDPYHCGYDHNEDPENQSCERLPIWSNPNRTYAGKPTGSLLANNAQAFNSTMPVAASWGTAYPYLSPAAPILTAFPGYCYGFNSVDWSSSPSAEVYQLFVREPYASDWRRIYHGVGLQMNMMVPQADGNWVLRVRACNGSGCSDFSNSAVIHYYQGCM